MTPRYSIWGWLTAEGRLKNQWARALTQSDVTRRIEELRKVQKSLRRDPVGLAHLWLLFLDAFLEPSLLQSLNADDFAAVEEMGAAISCTRVEGLRPEQIWFRVLAAHDARREAHAARRLLTQIHNLSDGDAELRNRCARELAQRGGRGDEHFKIYAQFLGRVSDPSTEADTCCLLAEVLAVDFNSDRVHLQRAAELAGLLGREHIRFPGAETALGLHALLLEQKPAEAKARFEVALRESQDDQVAVIGLLAALVRQGDHKEVAQVATSRPQPLAPIVGALVSLSTALNWLATGNMHGPPPAKAQGLSEFDLRLYAGDAVDLALGQLCLLEGDAARAASLLIPLAERSTSEPRVAYYAVWAALLSGAKTKLPALTAGTTRWRGRWTVACLLLDADPNEASSADFERILAEVPEDYAEVAHCRVALARGTRHPAAVEWKHGAGDLEEDLESFRTRLGYWFYVSNKRCFHEGLSSPLFQRLPLADQLFWRGLGALLTGEPLECRGILEQAAQAGHERAALALGIHWLEYNQLERARSWLNPILAVRRDSKVELLRAWLTECEGRTDAAAEILERLAAQKDPRAQYSLGHLYLSRSYAAFRAGHAEHCQLYRKQAASSLRAAANAAGVSIPLDAEVLARCAAFVAGEDQGIANLADAWPRLESLAAPRRRPWLLWHAGLAQLAAEHAPHLEAACGQLSALLENVDDLNDATLISLAQSATRACGRTVHPGTADHLTSLLGQLAARSGQEPIARLHRLGVTATARLRFREAGRDGMGALFQPTSQLAKADAANTGVALLLAQMHLDAQNATGAVLALRAARASVEEEALWLTTLADLIEGISPPDGSLHSTAFANSKAKARPAVLLLRAAAAFAANKLNEGYEGLLAALNIKPQAVIDVFKIDRCLPALCAQVRKGVAPPAPLLDAVRELCRTSSDIRQMAVVARCAAALGELEHANRLWEKIVNDSQAQDGSARREYGSFLCHLAVMQRKNGTDRAAVEYLRRATQLLV